jgi:hypothetical protein
MFDHEEHGCGAIGRWVGVACAGLGLATAALMLMGMGGFGRGFGQINFLTMPPELIIALVALFAAAAYLGSKAGVFLCQKQHALSMCMVVGIGVALGSIAISVWTGTFLGIVRHAGEFFGRDFTVLNLILAPFVSLLFILLFGGIPAMLLGALYGFLVRRGLRKLDA